MFIGTSKPRVTNDFITSEFVTRVYLYIYVHDTYMYMIYICIYTCIYTDQGLEKIGGSSK